MAAFKALFQALRASALEDLQSVPPILDGGLDSEDDAESAGGAVPFLSSAEAPALSALTSQTGIFNFNGPFRLALLQQFRSGEAEANPGAVDAVVREFILNARQGDAPVDNEIFGDEADDDLSGGNGVDVISGGQGDDVLTGGAGDDFLHGGEGEDVAVFSGDRDDYSVTVVDGSVFITDGTSGRDGEDELVHVETIRFADGDISLADLLASVGAELPTETPSSPPATGNPSTPPETPAETSADAASMLAQYADDLTPPERPVGSGNELWVGEGHPYATLSEAIEASSEGDTIYVDGGEYVNDVSQVSHSLSIIGIGDPPPVIRWDPSLSPDTNGNVPGGKGIIDVRAGAEYFYIENMHLDGAVVSAKNGSGLRLNNDYAVVVDCIFTNNEIGVLGGGQEGAELYVYGSTFSSNGVEYSLPGHGIYFHNQNRDDAGKLVVVDSEFIGTIAGHDVKSITDETILVGNRFEDQGVESLAAIDISGGGTVLVYENDIVDEGGIGLFYRDTRHGGRFNNVVIDSNTFTTSTTGAFVVNESGFVVNISNTAVETTESGVTVSPVVGYFRYGYGVAEVTDWSVNGASPVDIPFDVDQFIDRNGVVQQVQVVEGTEAADKLVVDASGDYTSVFAGGGDDTIYSTVTNYSQTIFAGDGNDTIVAIGPRSLVSAGAGDDIIIVENEVGGEVRSLGYEGNDIIFAGDVSRDEIHAGDGDDIIFLGSIGQYDEKVKGGNGFDIVVIDKSISDFSEIVVRTGGTVLRDLSGPNVTLAGVEIIQFTDGIYYVDTETFEAGVFQLDTAYYENLYNQIVSDFQQSVEGGSVNSIFDLIFGEAPQTDTTATAALSEAYDAAPAGGGFDDAPVTYAEWSTADAGFVSELL